MNTKHNDTTPFLLFYQDKHCFRSARCSPENQLYRSWPILTSTRDVMFSPVFICLFVCWFICRIIQKQLDGLPQNLEGDNSWCGLRSRKLQSFSLTFFINFSGNNSGVLMWLVSISEYRRVHALLSAVVITLIARGRHLVAVVFMTGAKEEISFSRETGDFL